MINLARCALLGLLLLAPSSGQAEEAALVVRGEVKTSLRLSLAELKALPTVKVNAEDPGSGPALYEGVPLHEILRRAGVPQGEALRGAALQLCVMVKATDGYKVVFALAELDPLFSGRQVLLAFRRNGEDLDPKTGPLRLVIPDEKRHSRWVRQVTEIEVIRASSGRA